MGWTPLTGKRRYTSETVKGTKKDAQLVLGRIQLEIDRGTFVEPARESLESYMTRWLAAKMDISPRTRLDYKRAIEGYINPYLGRHRLDRITTDHVEALYASLRDRSLSPNTIRLVHMPLSQALKKAVRAGTLARNPAEYASRPRLERKRVETLTPSEVFHLLRVSEEGKDSLHALWCVFLGGGLRPQEAYALKWEDLDGGMLRIERAVVQVGPGTYAVGETKTLRGRRSIPLPPFALTALEAHRSTQREFMLRKGPKFRRQGYIFTNAAGKPLEASRVRKLSPPPKQLQTVPPPAGPTPRS